MADTADSVKEGRYDFAAIEAKWQRYWEAHGTFRMPNPGEPGADASKPKYYILDMFPYPSGAGLHVGHPVGYCATDIFARYKRMCGFNVLHPMGFDSFGLPAEQHAIETNVHPADTTSKNIDTYRRQLRMFGFSYDWGREVATSDPSFYKFTQWCFLQMFNSWYDAQHEWTGPDGTSITGRARPIDELIALFEEAKVPADRPLRATDEPDEHDWKALSAADRSKVLDRYRLAYLAEVPVNWCPELGTVLANEEVDADGRSDRGSHPVFRLPLRQWMLRITKYAERLLDDLAGLDWPEPIKLMQRNWVGKSIGAQVIFPLADHWAIKDGAWACTCGRCAAPTFDTFPEAIRVFTTRPDTLFGATYMVLAPEHPLVDEITTDTQRPAVSAYIEAAKRRSDLDRTADTKEKTGVFTGGYAINPVNGQHVPVWIADYVLMGYGTGAIMAVPGHDHRDFAFAKAFDLPIVAVLRPDDAWLHEQISTGGLDSDYCQKAGKGDLAEQIMTSATHAAGALGGITAHDATARIDGDPGWVRQGPAPAYVADPGILMASFDGDGVGVNSPGANVGADVPGGVCSLNELTTADAKAKILEWLSVNGIGKSTTNYKLRDWIFSRQKYWGEPFPILHGEDGETIALRADELPLELPAMKDFRPTVVEPSDHITVPEPPLGRAKEWRKVVRGGKTYMRDLNTMPQWAGSCWYYLRFIDPANEARFCGGEAERYWMSVDLYVGGAEHAVLHLLYARFWHKVLYDLGHVSTVEPFKRLYNQGMIQGFAFEDERGITVGPDQVEQRGEDDYILKATEKPVRRKIAKMSKSLKNVVNPDEIIERHGADTFRLYEMYMGPLDASKPWNTRDVPGLHKLCQRIWRLVVDEQTDELSSAVSHAPADANALRILHKTIYRITGDLEFLKLNTAIAALFDFVNAMTPRKERSRTVIEPFVLLLAPFAPHLAEELWSRLGHEQSLSHEPWPAYDERLARDDNVEIGVQILGKMKSRITVPADADEETIQSAALADEKIQAALADKTVRRVIVVKGRLVNIVAN